MGRYSNCRSAQIGLHWLCFSIVHWVILSAITCRKNLSNSFESEKARRNIFGVINGANLGFVLAISLGLKTSCFAVAAFRATFAISSDDKKGYFDRLRRAKPKTPIALCEAAELDNHAASLIPKARLPYIHFVAS
jgi:hypothetical protein